MPDASFDPSRYINHLRAVQRVLDTAADDREKIGMGSPTAGVLRKVVGKMLDFPEAYLPGPALYEIPDCDVAAKIETLVTECSEIDISDDHLDLVEVVWKKAAGKSMGATVLGSCKPVGKRERQAWRGPGRAPWWRLTLALDVWLLLTEEERWRLVHHELMHATETDTGPKGRCHDVEDFGATWARYGLPSWGAMQTAAIGQVMAREEIAEEMRVYGVDPTTGQGLLFAPDMMRPVGW